MTCSSLKVPMMGTSNTFWAKRSVPRRTLLQGGGDMGGREAGDALRRAPRQLSACCKLDRLLRDCMDDTCVAPAALACVAVSCWKFP